MLSNQDIINSRPRMSRIGRDRDREREEEERRKLMEQYASSRPSAGGGGMGGMGGLGMGSGAVPSVGGAQRSYQPAPLEGIMAEYASKRPGASQPKLDPLTGADPAMLDYVTQRFADIAPRPMVGTIGVRGEKGGAPDNTYYDQGFRSYGNRGDAVASNERSFNEALPDLRRLLTPTPNPDVLRAQIEADASTRRAQIEADTAKYGTDAQTKMADKEFRQFLIGELGADVAGALEGLSNLVPQVDETSSPEMKELVRVYNKLVDSKWQQRDDQLSQAQTSLNPPPAAPVDDRWAPADPMQQSMDFIQDAMAAGKSPEEIIAVMKQYNLPIPGAM